MATVLLIDDNEYFLNHFEAILGMRIKNLRIVKLFDETGAIEMIGREKPDIVFMDILLYNNSGFPLLGEIKRKHPEQTVYVLTQHDYQDLRIRAREYGADGFISKNQVSGPEMAALIRVAAEKKRSKK